LRHLVVRRLAYAPEQLFALVGDVERYPQFVPWVTGLRSWNRQDLGEGVSTLDAEAQIRFSIVRERFATRVRLDAPSRVIDVDLLSGPFRRLKNRWSFETRPEAVGEPICELRFEIDFEFGSRFLHGLLAANFERAVAKLIDCFETRAAQLYGPSGSPKLP
jgi:coenzyme Q-binding protein COQ10